MSDVDPSRFKRRSFVYRRLIEAGANFVQVGDGAVADAMPGRGGLPRRLALVDLSPLPRYGFRGRGTMAWLAAQGLTPPAANNRARIQDGGALHARLADTEVLILPDPAAPEGRAIGLAAPPPDAGCYPVPRRDSHAWFLLTGRLAVPCLQKLIAVDLDPDGFPDLSVAQTIAARLATIVIRHNLGATPAFHLLSDSASAIYFWDVLIDAMREFHGAAAGLSAIRALTRIVE